MTNGADGSKLRAWRKERGLSQGECASEVGTSRQVWSGWERGRTVPNRTFMPKVRDVTKGAITADDFYPEQDCDQGLGEQEREDLRVGLPEAA